MDFSSFDDDLFGDSEPKVRATLDSDYFPIDHSPSWFVNRCCGSNEFVAARFAQKLGPLEIINCIEYLYSKRIYSECLHLCEQYLELNAIREQTDDHVLEIASRCCLKLDRPEDALLFVKSITDVRSPSIIFLTAYINRILGENTGRCNSLNLESLRNLIVFFKQRNCEYTSLFEVYLNMAQIELKDGGTFTNGWHFIKNTMLTGAIHVIQTTPRPITDFSLMNQNVEILKMQKFLENSSIKSDAPNVSFDQLGPLDPETSLQLIQMFDIVTLRMKNMKGGIAEIDDDC